MLGEVDRRGASGTGIPPPQDAADFGVVAEAPPKDYRSYATVGYLLALVSTLVLPPFIGPIAVWLGYVVRTRARDPTLRRQGMYVIAAGVVGTAIGLAVTVWIDQSGVLARGGG